MSLRVRCTSCRTAFLSPDEPPGGIAECPKCGARHRLASPQAAPPPLAGDGPAVPVPPSAASEVEQPADAGARTVFVPSAESRERSGRRRWLILLAIPALVLPIAAAVLVAWPRLGPRPVGAVERVADQYLHAIAKDEETAQRKLSTVEDPPAIRSYREVRRDRRADRTVKGSFAPIGRLHAKIAASYAYDPSIGRFTPKNPLGAAGETLDAVQAARENVEKSGLYDKMKSGDPDDIFDAAEGLGQVFSQLAQGAVSPKRVLPTYKTLVDDAKPPLPKDAKELADAVGEDPKSWDALLGRRFVDLKADGPFILDRAEVEAQAEDRLSSLGDPPTPLRLSLVRFRLEGIDTGWRVVAIRRVLPGDESGMQPGATTASPGAEPGVPPADTRPPARYNPPGQDAPSGD
ncbi:zinc ribbon domain-containing protein [Aquisphaera giovannonii]|uniref:hypothetical protein n=1 Tax=Aquisphaera giovannonii TaxID=406548 RepID=UPI0011DFDF63|nr:hypothetical protein [Aquisphaera giovannonii]